MRNLKEFPDGNSHSGVSAESSQKPILYIKRLAGFSRLKRKKGSRLLGSLKEEKIDGITLRQKAEKCKIWLQIAASPISQILRKKNYASVVTGEI